MAAGNEPDISIDLLNDLSLTELYAHETAFRVLLFNSGVTRVANRTHIVNDGFGSIKDVIDNHSNDVEGFHSYLKNANKTFASSQIDELRRYYAPVTISRLIGIVHYFNQCINTYHMVPDMSFITPEATTTLSTQYRQFKESVKKENDTDDEIDIPELKGSTNWVDFRDKFTTKLSQTRGARDIPLSYVIDDTRREVTRANAPFIEVDKLIDITEESFHRENATHFGSYFKEDNKTVWLKLKSLLLGLPAYNHISECNNSNNGRKAWFALKTFYQGEDFQDRLRESVFAKLSATFYRGETARFNFEKYIEIHTNCHKMLLDAEYNEGRGMDNATRVQYFKTGIKFEAGLESQLSNTRVNPAYKEFTNLVSYLQAEVEHKSLCRSQTKPSERDRNVSSFRSQRNKQNGGKGGSTDNMLSEKVDGKIVYSKRYSKEEFRSLTKRQRMAVVKLCKEMKKKSGPDSNRERGISSVTASNIHKELQEDMITLGEAIVAGVKAARLEEDCIVDATAPSGKTSVTESSALPSGSSSGNTKSKVPSGGVGDYFRRKRQRK